MKKKNIYKLNGIDCANCAQKIEDKLNKTDGVYEASLSFVIQKLFVTYEDTYEEPEKGFKKIIFLPRKNRRG